MLMLKSNTNCLRENSIRFILYCSLIFYHDNVYLQMTCQKPSLNSISFYISKYLLCITSSERENMFTEEQTFSTCTVTSKKRISGFIMYSKFELCAV